MLFTLLGIASALLFIVGNVPYLTDTLQAKTKPHRITWGVVALLYGIGFANQYASGATNSLWLFAASTLVVGVVFLVSLRNGVGGRSGTDIACLTISLTGVALWALLKSPLYSILANIIANAAALWPSYQKAKKDPESETRISWLVETISLALAAISVGKLDWQLLLLPVASIILQSYMVYILYVQAPGTAK